MTNHPELKACPFCNANVFVKSNRDWHRISGTHLLNCPFYNTEYPVIVPATAEGLEELLYTWNTRPSPIIPEDAIQSVSDPMDIPFAFKTQPATDDALLEAVNRSNGMQSFLSQHGHEVWVKDIETLITHAIKGQSK